MPRNWFNRSLPIPNIRTSVHDLSNDYKSSINFGGLYPTYVEEVVPKTKFLHLQNEVFLRFAPLQFPIMHRCKVRTNHFAIPYRLILGNDGYEDFHNGNKDIVPLTLTKTTQDESTYSIKNTILDYLGYQLPNISYGQRWIIPNPLALLSYLLVWRTWYADEVLDSALIEQIDTMLDGYKQAFANQQPLNDSATNFMVFLAVLPVSYTKDYFTAAQTEPQRGGDVYIMNPLSVQRVDGGVLNTGPLYYGVTGDSGSDAPKFVTPGGINVALRTPDTIRDLWQKEQLQRYRDIRALFGDRTNEYLAGHFGVISSDARLQMPQFIGGGEQIVQISEVVQTSSDTEDSPLGAMAGKGTSFGRSRSFRYFCEEHMFVLSLLSVVPDNGYMTGNPRYFYKKNILDFASPEFNNIGYQPVYNGEIFADGSENDKKEFGYQQRYSEYRQHRSIATGDFRDETLRAWHLNRSFDALPPLNAGFIHVNKADTARIFNNTDPDAQHIYIDVYTKSIVSSPVSYMPSSLHL